VKVGGTLLDNKESRDRLAQELSALATGGVQLAVVHGGGKQMTRFLAERGVESTFVKGLRVSSPEVIDAVLKVLAGTINHELVAAFIAAGSRAVGLSGIDACLVEAEQMDPALGAVGRPVRANAELLDLLCTNGFLPVIACVAGDKQGTAYNVNADQMAVAVAKGFRSDKLIFLTDVDGVRGNDGNILDSLTVDQSKALIDQGVATGGMQAKLNSAVDALMSHITQVVIAPGALQHATSRILAGEAVGTTMVRG
jgi:acetylglutamate kinase